MSKLRSKSLDNFGNDFGDHFKSKNDRPISDCITTISERYKRMDFRIHMHFSVSFSEYCAIFQYAENTPHKGIGAMPPITDCKRSRFDPRNLDDPMFISIVDLLEPKEWATAFTPFGQIYGFEQRTTTAVIWLQPLNNCLMFRAEQLNHILPLNFEFCLIQKDRELESFAPCNCFRFIRSVKMGKLIDEMIKCGAKIMGNLSDMYTPVSFRGRPTILTR